MKKDLLDQENKDNEDLLQKDSWVTDDMECSSVTAGEAVPFPECHQLNVKSLEYLFSPQLVFYAPQRGPVVVVSFGPAPLMRQLGPQRGPVVVVSYGPAPLMRLLGPQRGPVVVVSYGPAPLMRLLDLDLD